MKLHPAHDEDHRDHPRRRRAKKRPLRTVAMLPTLLTLANLYFGFAAVYCCGREMMDIGGQVSISESRTLDSVFIEKRAPSYLSIGVWFLIGAMICDALDGRVARRTGRSSRFGEQLDTLADMVSFGVAPALMMVTLMHRELGEWGYSTVGADRFSQAAVFVGSVYVCCTALRLARFTIEASSEEAAHEGFRGLPSPGACSGVISVIFLHDHLDTAAAWEPFTDALVAILIPWTLVIALLMVSRLPYRHAVSSFLSRRPFGHISLVLFGLPLFFLYTEQFCFLLAWSFVASGVIRYIYRLATGTPDATAATADDPIPNEPSHELKRQSP